MDDSISRRAAIDICAHAISLWHGQLGEGALIAVRDKIKELPSAQPAEASCWGCNCPKMERLKEQKTFSEMVHLHDAETHGNARRTRACDLISRLSDLRSQYNCFDESERDAYGTLSEAIKVLSAQPEPQWIPCSERLPEDIKPVIITWKNTDPKSYYQYIVGKHFTGTACYKNGKWYWYSSVTEDMLSEYGRYDSEEFDEAIECIAWMPLPSPYQAERREE